MSLRERFVLVYAATVFATSIVLTSYELELYFSLYVIELLLLLEFLASYQRSLSRALRPVAIALSLGFLYILAQKVIEILLPTL